MKRKQEDLYEGCIGSRINMEQVNQWIENLLMITCETQRKWNSSLVR